MRYFLLLLCLGTFTTGLCQYKISGKIIDTRKGSKNASVELLNAKDSTLISSTLSAEDGIFTINNVPSGAYLLSVSMVGSQKYLEIIKVDNADIRVKDINLAEASGLLLGVTVTATKPFLEQKADKLIVNVEGSATAAGSTALEVLQKVPGIIITNDKVSMVGKNNINIMIDGRSSQYTDMNQLLRDMPAANIERIEVIANPGAKYEASGGAIINIVLKRNANLGTNGNVSLALGRGLYDKDDPFIDRGFYRVVPNISLNHRKGKWNLYGGYTYFHRNAFEQNLFNRQVGGSRYIQTNYAPNDANSHTYRLGVDYYVDKKNTVGLLYRGFNRNGDIITNNLTEETRVADGQLLSRFTTITAQSYHRTNSAWNMNWKHSFDTTGRDLNIDIDYSFFQLDNISDIEISQTTGPKSLNRQDVDNPVQFGVVKADYSHPFNEKLKVDAGLKSSIAQIDNYLLFYRNGMVDAGASNNFFYKENINAAYISFASKLDNWEFTGGLRGEQTIAKGNSGTVKTLDRSYFQVFPSAFVTRKINKDLSANAQFSKRVSRPSFQQQNPFTFFIDSITYTKGNPLIKPEITNASKLSLTYQGQPFFAVSYNVTEDVIFQNAPKQEGNRAYATPENLGRFENYAIELNFPIKFGKTVSGYGGNQAIYNHYKADYLGGVYDKSRWHWIAYGQVAYKPTTSLSFEVSGFYSTKFLNEFITLNSLGNINFAIQKTFWEKKGRISLNLNDLLYSNKTKADIVYQDFYVHFDQRSESRNIRLVFSYSFGNQQLKAARSRNTASDTETNRVKTN